MEWLISEESVDKGMEFYGFLENVFIKKLKPNLQETLKVRYVSLTFFELTFRRSMVTADQIDRRIRLQSG